MLGSLLAGPLVGAKQRQYHQLVTLAKTDIGERSTVERRARHHHDLGNLLRGIHQRMLFVDPLVAGKQARAEHGFQFLEPVRCTLDDNAVAAAQYHVRNRQQPVVFFTAKNMHDLEVAAGEFDDFRHLLLVGNAVIVNT